MQKPLKQEKMTPDEAVRLEEILEEHNDSPGRFAAIPSLFVTLIGLAAFIAPLSMDFLFSAILFWPAGAGAIWFAWLGFKASSEYEQTLEALEEDRESGLKEVLHGELQRKRETRGRYGNMHFITVLDTEYPVDVTTYTRFDNNDQVAVSVSPKSRSVVGIVKAGQL